MTDLRTLVADAFRRQTLQKLTLSRPASKASEVTKVTVRPVVLKDETVFQFAVREGTQERHENHDAAGAARRFDKLFPRQFQDAHVFTSEGDFSGRKQPDGRIKLRRSAASKLATTPETHNREKHRLIPEGVPCPFLIEIGVMAPTGQVRADKQHKFRQINRFLEFVDDIVQDLPKTGPLHVVDFGCGKSSLTFAVHHLLTAIHGREVKIRGLDRNPSVIDTCRQIAADIGTAGLEFEVGDIAGHSESEPVHLAISLHACDTATDFALAKAVEWKADVILAVPCCQHEIAPQLQNEDLAPLLRHGILRERLATLVTDALRAEWLAAQGYRTQVLEFIDLEHTPKNLLLRAVRRPIPTPEAEAHRQSAERLAAAFQISNFTLNQIARESTNS